MKRTYLTPATAITGVVKASQALASSGGASGAPAKRNDYTGGGSVW